MMNTEIINGQKLLVARYLYDGVFIVDAEVTDADWERLKIKAHNECPFVSVVKGCVNVDYSGPDKLFRVLKFLAEIAPVLKESRTEVPCLIFSEDLPRVSDFFVAFLRIQGGQLFRQFARVERFGESTKVPVQEQW